MANGSPRSLIQMKLRSKALLLGGLLLLLLFSVNWIRSWKNNRAVDQEITGLKDNVSQIEQDNFRLAELIKYLNSTAYLEEKARTDLGLRKPGEQAVIVPNTPAAADTNQAAPQTAPTQATANPQRWWRYFFAKK